MLRAALRTTHRTRPLVRSNYTKPRSDSTAYEILQIPRDASDQQIKTAYRQLARRWHPDVSQHANAVQVFPHITRAHGILSCPDKRLLYDFTLANGRVFAKPARFVDFYARAGPRLVRLFHRRHHMAWGIVGLISAPLVALRARSFTASTSDVDATPPPTAALGSLFAGAVFSAGPAVGRQRFQPRTVTIAGCIGLLLGRGCAELLDRYLGRPLRWMRTQGARRLIANSRPVSEALGALCGVFLLCRGGTVRPLEAHFRLLRSGAVGALFGHGIA
jgi:hypothetical protein